MILKFGSDCGRNQNTKCTFILKTFSFATQTLISLNQTKPDRKNDSNSDILNQRFQHIKKRNTNDNHTIY